VPVINHVKREINAKLVYVGPTGAGKKTSMNLVHARLRPECRSEVRRRGAGAEELLFFDFLPREIGNVDVSVVCETPKLAPHRTTIERNLSDAALAPVTVKGRRAEGLGALGRREGIACWAVAVVTRP
jgi:ABC-type branched-subunit amino acid transport system ATPase component